MKKYLIITFFFFLSEKLLFAQNQEWQNVTHLLQKEALYFSGKKGFIQLLKNEYNTFEIKDFAINDSLFVSKMLLSDRFGNKLSQRFIKEIVVLTEGFEIQSAQIFYHCSFYFEDFPKTQFLLITFDVPQIHQITSVYKDLETKKEEQTTLEDVTTQILIPIRTKNREKIFAAIDSYQQKTKKEQLITNQNH